MKKHIYNRYTKVTFCGHDITTDLSMRGYAVPDCKIKTCTCMDDVDCEECILLNFQNIAEGKYE